MGAPPAGLIHGLTPGLSPSYVAMNRGVELMEHPWQRREAIYGRGSAVVDLIFSMAKREVTFFNGMVAMSCL